MRADTFLLDTETGKTWRMTSYTDLKGNPDLWLFIDRADDDYQLGLWIKTQTFKEPVQKANP